MARSIHECYAGTYLAAQDDPRKPGNFTLADMGPNPRRGDIFRQRLSFTYSWTPAYSWLSQYFQDVLINSLKYNSD